MECKVVRLDLADGHHEKLFSHEARGFCCDFVNFYHRQEAGYLAGRDVVYLIVDPGQAKVWRYVPMSSGVSPAEMAHVARIAGLLGAEMVDALDREMEVNHC